MSQMRRPWTHARFSDATERAVSVHEQTVQWLRETIDGFQTPKSYGYGPHGQRGDVTGVRRRGFKAALRLGLRMMRTLHPDVYAEQHDPDFVHECAVDGDIQYALDDPELIESVHLVPDGFVVDLFDRRFDVYEVEHYSRLSVEKIRSYFWLNDQLHDCDASLQLLVVDIRDRSIRPFNFYGSDGTAERIIRMMR